MGSAPAQTATYSMGLARGTIWACGRLWAAKGFLAVLDQGLISGPNFLMGILLARWLAPEQYGAFALAFAAFLLLSLFYQALLIEPQSVLGPSAYRDSQRHYLGLLLRIQTGVALATFLVLGLSAWLVRELAPSGSLWRALAGITFTAPCVLLFWLVRGACYVKLAPQTAVIGGVFYSSLVLGGLFVACRWSLLSPFAAFLLMALAAAATSGLLLIRLRPALKLKTGIPTSIGIVRQHWAYGRWALASAVVTWIPWNIYYALLGKFVGMTQAGSLRALLNLFSPMAQGCTALCLLFLPYAARISQDDGLAGIRNLAKKITLLFAGASIGYWGIIILFREPILRFLYAGKYLGVSSLLSWVALAAVLWTSAYGPAVALRGMQSPASVFVFYAASSASTLAIGIPAVRWFGLRGAILAIIGSSAVALVVGLVVLRRKLRRLPQNRS